MRHKEPPRVRGPYKERRGWRLVVFEGTGRRALHFSTEAESQRKKAALTRQLERAAYLRQLCDGKHADEYIFSFRQHSEPPRRQSLWREIHRICRLANVPIVCPHSLRGLYATLAVDSGAVADAVAASLGHGSFAMTERHYAEPASVMNARTARVASLLPGSDTDERDAGDTLDLLRKLDRATLTRLLTLVKKEGTTYPN